MASFRKRFGKWQVRVQRVNQPSLSKTFVSKQQAEAWARRMESKIDEGDIIEPLRNQKIQLAELLTKYKLEVSPKKKGAEVEIIRIKRMIRDEPITRQFCNKITGKSLAEYRDSRLKVVSSTTVRLELALLSSLFNTAIREWGYNLINPVNHLLLPKANKARARRLTSAQLDSFLESLHVDDRSIDGVTKKAYTRNPLLRPLVLLAIETAMRQGELLAISWSDIHLDIGFARLHDTKNGDVRDVPLSKAAVSVLESLSSDRGGKVFPMTSSAVKQCFRRAVERFGLSDFHFHDLRHEGTSRLAEKLTNVLELSAVTGHKDLRMLNRYYHPRMEYLLNKIN